MRAAASARCGAPCGGNSFAWRCPGSGHSSGARRGCRAKFSMRAGGGLCFPPHSSSDRSPSLSFPHVKWRWSALRWIGRGTLAAMGIPLVTKGVDGIPGRGAVLVFNHSSYMDALVLATVLPGEPAIVAKREIVYAASGRSPSAAVGRTVCRAL